MTTESDAIALAHARAHLADALPFPGGYILALYRGTSGEGYDVVAAATTVEEIAHLWRGHACTVVLRADGSDMSREELIAARLLRGAGSYGPDSRVYQPARKARPLDLTHPIGGTRS